MSTAKLHTLCGVKLLFFLGGFLFFVNTEAAAVRLHLLHELRLAHGEKKDDKRHQHQGRNHTDKGGVAHQSVLTLAGLKDNAEHKNDDTACRAHQVDDGVALTAERLDRDVGHQGDGGRAEDRH